MSYNILNNQELEDLKQKEPQRFSYLAEGSLYLNLQQLELVPMDDFDTERLGHLAKIWRGLVFATVEGAKSGHPGGSSSKVEQILALLFSGVLAFNPLDPKNVGRSRLVWSAGHCSPLLHATLAIIYGSLKRRGHFFDKDALGAVMPTCLAHFRHCDGPTGHVESFYALADASTGSSGHGFSAALGLALLQRSNGLKTKVYVLAGDAETEEGISYEARNVINATGTDNLVVSVDYNLFGIDGPIADVISSPYVNHWFGPGFNIIEVDGHNLLELAYAYHKATTGFGNGKSTAIICHTIKGKAYGKWEGTADSHGTPAPHDDYVAIIKNLGFDIAGVEGKIQDDIDRIIAQLNDDDVAYIIDRLEVTKSNLKSEQELLEQMKIVIGSRPLVDYKKIRRPDVLPIELIFKEGELVATRKATEAWFKWLMDQTAFFYIGAGDLMKSILTGAAESVYGVISKDNPHGRGLRFGIAEQNMAMLSATLTQDVLPGGFQAMSAFATYGVFTSIMSNPVRMALIGNAVNPKMKGFFIMLAAHDGPETGEDGPTHHGLFWMSLFDAYPGIKVYKPLDANETIEMLFYAMERGEPIALSVMRPGTPVLKRGQVEDGWMVPSAREAINGAYVYKPFRNNGQQKRVLVISGGQVMANTLAVLPELEQDLDIKIVAVTSPELFEEFKGRDPQAANEVLADEERQYVITLHNGWPGFLYRFLLPTDYKKRAIGIDRFLKSGPPAEVYKFAEFDPQGLKEKILRAM